MTPLELCRPGLTQPELCRLGPPHKTLRKLTLELCKLEQLQRKLTLEQHKSPGLRKTKRIHIRQVRIEHWKLRPLQRGRQQRTS